MKHNDEFDRALAHDDYLELRRASRAAAYGQYDNDRCQILFHYEETCDQCGRKTFRPHLASKLTFCRRCCPACASAEPLVTRPCRSSSTEAVRALHRDGSEVTAALRRALDS